MARNWLVYCEKVGKGWRVSLLFIYLLRLLKLEDLVRRHHPINMILESVSLPPLQRFCLSFCTGSLEVVNTLTPIEIDACIDYVSNLLGPLFHLIPVGSRRRGTLRILFVDVLLLKDNDGNGKNHNLGSESISKPQDGIMEEEILLDFEDAGAAKAGEGLEEALRILFSKSYAGLGPLLDVLRVGTRRAIISMRYGVAKVMIDIRSVLHHESSASILHSTGPLEFLGRVRKLFARTHCILLPWAVIQRLDVDGAQEPGVGLGKRKRDRKSLAVKGIGRVIRIGTERELFEKLLRVENGALAPHA
ncbi:hypothetical protein HDU67_006758, partial [Dinochytrium kinnereticum]